MKKSILFQAIAAIAVCAVSCDLQVNVEESVSHKVDFRIAEPATKTVIGTRDGDSFPVLWNGGENIEISLNENTGSRDLPTTVSVASSPSASATWSYDFGSVITSAGLTSPYVFHAFYPGQNVRAFYYNYEPKIKIENMPSVQTPTAVSCDPLAMFVYSISGQYPDFPTEVTMPEFQHMGAYACITLGTGIPSDAVVESVTVTANDGTHLCGPAWFWYADHDSYVKGSWSDHSTTSGADCSIKINTTSKSNIWMACRPTTDLTSLTFEVKTNKGSYTKTVSTTKQFASGKVATMTVNGFTPMGTVISYVWSVVTNNIVTGECTASSIGTVKADSLYARLSWSGEGNKIATQTVSNKTPDMDWTFAITTSSGSYYAADGTANNRVKLGSGTKLMTNIAVDVPVDSTFIIKKVSVWSSKVDGTSGKWLKVQARVGENYIIGSSTTGEAVGASTTATKLTGIVTTSNDVSSQGLTGPVHIVISDNYPIYLYKIQVDCIDLD